jgi:hypothetical protein
MHLGLLTRLVFLICVFSACLYSYIDKQNSLTKLRIEQIEIERDIALLCEENKKLQYDIDQFESPSHLMELARCIEFSHLKHPLINEIFSLNEGLAMQVKLQDDGKDAIAEKKKIPIAVGAK